MQFADFQNGYLKKQLLADREHNSDCLSRFQPAIDTGEVNWIRTESAY